MRAILLFFPWLTFAANIVFIHIGPSIPDYTSVAIKQASIVSPNSYIYFIASGANAFCKKEQFAENVSGVELDAIPKTRFHKMYERKTTQDTSFRDGFWRYTTERFLTLYDFCKQRKLQEVFHLENDVLLYIDVEKYTPLFRKHFPYMAVTADCDKRVVAGLIYFAGNESMELLAKEAMAGARGETNDMHILSNLRCSPKGNNIKTLPVVPQDYKPLRNSYGTKTRTPKIYSNAVFELGLLFDACALGQYLGGIDPRNDYGNLHVGFINELTLFNPSKFTYHWETRGGLRFPYLTYKGKTYPIANLHIHSKRLELFRSF